MTKFKALNESVNHRVDVRFVGYEMKFFFSFSIRQKLLFLIFVAVLPALGIILYSGLERREKEKTTRPSVRTPM